jgi:hypothetical protein
MLIGCRTPPVRELGELRGGMVDASEFIANELKTKKIVFIGESHLFVNPKMFIAENIQKFYNAGVRYLFDESGLPDYVSINDENYKFYMFYPWMTAGWRFEGAEYFQAVNRLNSTLPKEEQIKVIAPEVGRESLAGIEPEDRLNYRDTVAARNIIETMDNTSAGEKALILYGWGHGSKKRTRDRGFLGALLYEHYGNAFAVYRHYSQSLDSPFGAGEWKTAEIHFFFLPRVNILWQYTI